MQRTLLRAGLVALAGFTFSVVQARDVDLRTRGEGDAAVALPAATTGGGSGAQRMSTEERIARLEAIADGQMLDLLMRLQTMEREFQLLRGEAEVHGHQIADGSKKQKDLYLDLDRRLQVLEKQLQTMSAAAPAAVAATSAPATPAKPAEAAADKAVQDDQQAYQQALDHLYQQQFDKAITGFRGYIQKYPKGRYAHVSQYWIAEAYFAQNQYKQAVAEYQKLINEYPTSPKLAEAMLKAGDCHLKLNDSAKAQNSFEQVVRSYPGTEEAKQAQAALQKLKTKPAAATPPKKKPN